jgi:hypothetical protein
MTKKIEPKENGLSVQYDSILGDISKLIDGARRSAARSVNCVMTAAYWLIGKQLIHQTLSGESEGTEIPQTLSAESLFRTTAGK